MRGNVIFFSDNNLEEEAYTCGDKRFQGKKSQKSIFFFFFFFLSHFCIPCAAARVYQSLKESAGATRVRLTSAEIFPLAFGVRYRTIYKQIIFFIFSNKRFSVSFQKY